MNEKNILVAAAIAIGLLSPMAIAKDGCHTNEYFSAPLSTTTSSPVVIEKTMSSSNGLQTTTISAPVTLTPAGSPVVIEDRIIKNKHLFGIGIWPLFDFTIL